MNPGLPDMSRRDFLRAGAAAATVLPAACTRAAGPEAPREARFQEAMPGGDVRCGLCPWQCVVSKGGRGACGVRENRDGRLFSLVYGRPCAANNDPIEKKPFFHVYPGSLAYSIATAGCNLHCKFCQNWQIAKSRPEDFPVAYRPPEAVAEAAVRAGARTVAYTYSEPTVFYEYMADCAGAARARGLGNVVVSNGFIAPEPLRKLLPLLTAYKVDLKSFSQRFYEETCEGRLQPVLDTLKLAAGSGVWLEIVVLVIPTLNDGGDEIKRLAAWVLKEVGQDVPLHFTRFHPSYKLRNLPVTPPETVHRARRIALAEGCRYVYTGNLPGGEGDNTYCPACRACVVRRVGHTLVARELREGGKCACGQTIPGVWG